MSMKEQSELIRDITDPGWREREAAHHAMFLERLAQVPSVRKQTAAQEEQQLAARVPEIDYEALIAAAFKRDRKWAQGTNGCVAFKSGAEWFREIAIAAAQQPERVALDLSRLRPFVHGLGKSILAELEQASNGSKGASHG